MMRLFGIKRHSEQSEAEVKDDGYLRRMLWILPDTLSTKYNSCSLSEIIICSIVNAERDSVSGNAITDD